MMEVRSSRILCIIPLLIAVCFLSLPAHAQYGGGTGEPNDPYLIYTAGQINAIGLHGEDWHKHFKLMADIDLTAYTGADFNIISYFRGIFDGNNHTISNFSYTSTDANDIGLFGFVNGGTAQIRDLGLINPNVDAGTGIYVGSLVGRLWDGTVNGCYAQGGSVSGRGRVGGLVGEEDGAIINSHATCSVSGGGAVGGLVGIDYGTLTNCYATGDVSGNYSVGGLAGHVNILITNCYATGSVLGDERVGGLAGYGNKITNCYAMGSVSGDKIVGGLVGYHDAFITNCYSIGRVTGSTDVGGLVGHNSWRSRGIFNSFWDTQTSGRYNMCGSQDPEGAGCDNTKGKTTAEMKMESTFFGWWSGSVWTIDEGADYPRLALENIPGRIITNPYWVGSGTEEDPYLIYTAGQLNIIGLVPSDWDKNFRLLANIDLSEYTGTAFNLIGRPIAFSGVFDGNGHTISNFSYTSTDADNIGLFGRVSGENAHIKNLGLIDPNVDAGTGSNVGSLVGYMIRGGTITGCYVEGGSVSGNYNVGGLVGLLFETITNCYSTNTVSGNECVGGLVGLNRGTVSNCYAVGSVTGTLDVGGLIGNKSFLGTGTIAYSFWDIETSGQATSAGGTGKTTAEIQMKSTFTDAGWDFVD
ncbi:MAG: GLUG motif-containing protein, partial [Planctomycetota bacterium]